MPVTLEVEKNIVESPNEFSWGEYMDGGSILADMLVLEIRWRLTSLM